VLAYLLSRVHVLQATDGGGAILGAACPTTPTESSLQLPPLAGARPPVATIPANDAQAARAQPRVTVQPWHGADGFGESAAGLAVHAATQTSDLCLQGADEMLAAVLSAVRPWGKSAPQAGCAWVSGGGKATKRSKSRGAVAEAPKLAAGVRGPLGSRRGRAGALGPDASGRASPAERAKSTGRGASPPRARARSVGAAAGGCASPGAAAAVRVSHFRVAAARERSQERVPA
jgi:hypothetical protein